MSEPEDPLAHLQRHIDEAKAQSGMGDTPPGASPVDTGQAMRLVVELASGIAVGGASGYFLDRWTGTFPLFFIVGFFLGAAAGFRNLIRAARKTDE